MATPNAGLLVEMTLVCRRGGGKKFLLKNGFMVEIIYLLDVEEGEVDSSNDKKI